MEAYKIRMKVKPQGKVRQKIVVFKADLASRIVHNEDDIVSHAVSAGLINSDDMEDVIEAVKISDLEYVNHRRLERGEKAIIAHFLVAEEETVIHVGQYSGVNPLFSDVVESYKRGLKGKKNILCEVIGEVPTPLSDEVYAAAGSGLCPFCLCDEIEGDHVYIDACGALQEVSCSEDDCPNHGWSDSYRLDGYCTGGVQPAGKPDSEPKMYLITAGRYEPQILGPFATKELRDLSADLIRSNIGNGDILLILDIPFYSGKPEVRAFPSAG